MAKQPVAKRYPIGLRVTPTMRDRIVAAADESGRSIAQEAEHRLEMSFFREQEIYGGPHTEALLKALAMTVRFVEAKTGKRWIDDRDTAAQMVAEVLVVIQSLATVSPEVLRQKMAERGSERMVNTLRLALDLFGLSTEDLAEAYGIDAGKPHGKATRK
jgi:hypothetical protein